MQHKFDVVQVEHGFCYGVMAESVAETAFAMANTSGPAARRQADGLTPGSSRTSVRSKATVFQPRAARAAFSCFAALV